MSSLRIRPRCSSSWGSPEKCLANGQKVLAQLRFKISASMLGLGLALSCIFGYMDDYYFRKIVYNLPEAWEKYLWVLLMASIFFFRFVLFGLAPLADDMRVMRLSMAVDMVVLMVHDVIDIICDPKTYIASFCGFPYQRLVFLCNNVFLFVSFVRASWSQTAPSMSTRMWCAIWFWLWVNILDDFVAALYASFKNKYVSHIFFWVPPQLLVVVFISRPRLRQHCQRWVNISFERRSEKLAAAGVAGLVGRCSSKEVVAQAGSRFRSVRLADLCFEDIEDNKPNPALFVKTAPETLHCCDAFVSHSWHDDARAKWTAIQEWRKGFVHEHGREPNVWFDKCCIDQNNIECDLRCLPIFLSGCKRMVVFCGPTYLSRLWCIVELFTFVHMGRSLDKIDFVLVKREGHEDEDASSVEDSFDDFDAEECQCFLPEDKERIHTIILTAFGTVSGFNRVVQDIFRQSQMEETLMRQCSTVPGRVPSYSARSSPRNGADRSQPPSSEDSTGSSDTTSTSRNDGESEEDG